MSDRALLVILHQPDAAGYTQCLGHSAVRGVRPERTRKLQDQGPAALHLVHERSDFEALCKTTLATCPREPILLASVGGASTKL